jgi:shikimate dehydrogenase
MKRLAVLGHPVAHSRSPQIHTRFGQDCGVALDYQALDVAPEALADRLQALHAEGWHGLNLTLPHKSAALALCVSLSDRAQRAGAVNTLVRAGDGWHGDNTDGEGCLRDLRDNLGVTIRGRRVLVLGAGGAARGILEPLLAEQPASLAISNRNPWKPEALAQAFAALGTVLPRTHLALKGDSFDLILNATSAGHTGEMPRLPGQLLAPGGVCYDLSYGTAFAPFAAWARAQGAAAVHDGLGMLVEQAAAAFALWFGQRPDTRAVLAALRG